MAEYFSNVVDNRQLIVLAATTPDHEYYGEFFDDISDFLYEIDEADVDNKLVVVKEEHMEAYLDAGVRADMLLFDELADVWMRDFTTIGVGVGVNVFFGYHPNYMEERQAHEIQDAFRQMLANQIPEEMHDDLLPMGDPDTIIDGGNVVENMKDSCIIMDRVCSDNKNLDTHEKFRDHFMRVMPYKKVALIPDDGSRCGHSDGVCQFIETDVVVMSCGFGGSVDEKMRRDIEREIKSQLGERTKIIQLKSKFTDDTKWREFDSAAGLHVNMVVTTNACYVPVFGHDPENVGQTVELDDEVLNQLRSYTSKKVVGVPVNNKICRMGGSCRCLSWQTRGKLANELVKRARLNGIKIDPDVFENAMELKREAPSRQTGGERPSQKSSGSCDLL